MSSATEPPQSSQSRRRALIIGASYAGLVAALALRGAGWATTIIEKSTTRLRTGGGVVVQPRMLAYLESKGVAFPGVASVPAIRRSYWSADGTVSRAPESAAAYTSWDILLRELEELVDETTIRRGVALVDLPDYGREGAVVLDNGERLTADLVVAADGIGSRVRQILAPGLEPAYAGYVAWRGLADESQLNVETVEMLSDSLSSFRGRESVILLYEVPGADGSVRAGHRRINWVWYEPVPTDEALGQLMTDRHGEMHRSTVARQGLTDAALDHMRALAERDLSPPFREVVLTTEQPFVQKIEDLLLPRLVYGRTVIIGDAASLIRPHIGSGTAKAVEDAISLAEAVCSPRMDLEPCLRTWEQTRLDDHHGLSQYARAVASRLGLGRAVTTGPSTS